MNRERNREIEQRDILDKEVYLLATKGEVVKRESKKMTTPTTTIPASKRISITIKNNITLILPTVEEVDEIKLEAILKNPAVLGFMEAFAAKQFCDENLRFFIGVEQWLEALHVKSETDQASEAMAIYNEFIAANSPTEICLSSKTRETVEEGLKKIPPVNTVFDAALEEVYGTLQRDLYLRFKASDDLKILKQLLAMKRTADDIVSHFHRIGVMPDSLWTNPNFKIADINFKEIPLETVLSDKYMVRVFTTFLTKSHAAENVMLVLSVKGFKKLFKEKDEITREIAWLIYVAFILQGSEYQVSTDKFERQKIAFQLGKPKIDMFDKVHDACYILQRAQYTTFKTSDDFKTLEKVLIDAKKLKDNGRESPSPRSSTCVAF